ncbi:MAG: class I SAM-dependent methyltransferase [Candidatus Abyssobacteria bacterium SURF_5]|uniref:Class I SAM-dependent methyltransferase n=1 Tax=Abyssobacteria bacterium (strain SURF_5) TaxID=2093360 RepID=A0A3A4NP12_ABYX5|nr:MAG: class I SAM-dependent methyltransferase [Candidatus Abyssubacteria bacterium SURF_5]
MSFIFKIRDLIRPPELVLAEVDIRPGHHVLDYGCGPGSLTIAAAQIVGESGKVYALDLHEKAIQKVKQRAAANRLKNVQTILADSPAQLDTESVDVVLLYDIFHMLGDQAGILRELHRVLRPDGILSFSDHHMKEKNIMEGVTGGNLFRLKQRGKRTYTFQKIQDGVPE